MSLTFTILPLLLFSENKNLALSLHLPFPRHITKYCPKSEKKAQRGKAAFPRHMPVGKWQRKQEIQISATNAVHRVILVHWTSLPQVQLIFSMCTVQQQSKLNCCYNACSQTDETMSNFMLRHRRNKKPSCSSRTELQGERIVLTGASTIRNYKSQPSTHL